MIQIIVPGIVVNAKDKKPVVGAEVTVFLLGKTSASVPLEVLKTKTGAGGAFIAVSKSRDENIDIKRIVGKVVCPKSCKPAYFTAPSAGKVEKKGTFLKTAKAYFNAAKGLTSGNIKDTVDGANSIILGATRVVATHKVTQKPVLCCAEVVGVGVRAGFALLFEASNEKLKKAKKAQRKRDSSRFEENDERRALFSAVENIGASLIDLVEDLQTLDSRFEPSTRVSVVLEGKAQIPGEVTFSTGNATFAQAVAADATAHEVAEQLAMALQEAGFTVFGPSPAAGEGVALHVSMDENLLPVLSANASLAKATGMSITRLENTRFLVKPGLGGSSTVRWRSEHNVPPVFRFQDTDTGEIFEHSPDIPAQESPQALANALQDVLPNVLVETLVDGQLQVESFGGDLARLIGVREQNLMAASISGGSLSVAALRKLGDMGKRGPEDLMFLEEIGPVTAAALEDAGVPDLATLESVDAAHLRVATVGEDRLQRFVGMAKIARTFPNLSKDDVQVLVEELGIPDDASLLDRLSSLSEVEIRRAAQQTETPQEYDPARLIELISQLRR